MDTTWYGNQTPVEAAVLGTLAVVAPMLKRLCFAEIVDRHLTADSQLEFSYGQVLSVLVAARACRPTALSNVALWAADSEAELFLHIPPEKLNDDRLGRALDRFYEVRHSIAAEFTLFAAQEFDIELDTIHTDPTHILFTGAYDDSLPRDGAVEHDAKGHISKTRCDADLAPAHITAGRVMDDAPKGTAMVHANLSVRTDRYGPMLIFGHTVDGNQNSHTAISEHLALWNQLFPKHKPVMVSDRGTFSVGHLTRLRRAGHQAILAAPWDDVRELFHQQRATLKWQEATYLSIEQQRRRSSKSELPLQHYEIAETPHTFRDPASGEEIATRVLFVLSTSDRQTVRQQRQKQIDSIRAGLEKLRVSVSEGRRNTDAASIPKRVARIFGERDAAKYFKYELLPLSEKEQAQLPPPQKGCRRPTQRFEFHFDETLQTQDAEFDGYSALVTTVPAETSHTDAVFTSYRNQIYCEQVNAHVKGPIAIRPVWLKSPKRVEALLHLLLIAAQLHLLIQRAYRQSVPEKASMKEQRTTSKTLLHQFESYSLLIEYLDEGRIIRPTRLTARQRDILKRLGLPTPAETLSRSLPRPPS